MGNLKELFRDLEEESMDVNSEDEVDVYADSVRQALELASKEFQVDISMLNYEIIEKGTKGFVGVGRRPYRLLVRPEREEKYRDLQEIEMKLSKIAVSDEIELKKMGENVDGECNIRVTKSGIWLTVKPTKGKGKRVDISDVSDKLNTLMLKNVDYKKVEKGLKNQSGDPIKIGDWSPNPDYDGTMSVEISDDEMKAYVHFVPPRRSGRHMELDDILEALKDAGVVAGIDEKRIEEYLAKVDYSESLVAAEGVRPKHGRDAHIDYKVSIDKSQTVFEEDEKGQVDFKDLDLLENVVVGQLLATKVSLEEGVPGRTVTNRVIPAKSGKDIILKYGKGTILSEDGRELTAEINGQVVYNNGKISVEPVYFVKGDVSLQTGNIVFLGSVIVSGSVQDNFIVKAAGNIEIRGSVQKAYLEAEGDIIAKNGIVGRDDAKIESTGGSVYAKFIQTANVIADKDVIVSEGILHSHVDGGGRVLCNGRRAKIVGGVIRAGEEVNAKFLGSESFTKTDIKVGINPKVLQQISDMNTIKREVNEEFDKIKLDINTLTVQKNNSGGYLPPDKEELFNKLISQKQKLNNRLSEITLELDELKAYLSMLEKRGKICVEKNVFPGVEVYIQDNRFSVKDPYTNIKFSLENEGIRLSEYEPPQLEDSQSKMMGASRSR